MRTHFIIILLLHSYNLDLAIIHESNYFNKRLNVL